MKDEIQRAVSRLHMRYYRPRDGKVEDISIAVVEQLTNEPSEVVYRNTTPEGGNGDITASPAADRMADNAYFVDYSDIQYAR